MYLRIITIVFISLVVFITSCSKKHQPQSSPASKTDTIAKKEVVKKIKAPLPKILTVDDRAAKKTADGRLYYDLEGKRYWRNYDDGKYYLFNKKMYNDPAFKPH
ncbi:MAG: hypothetical protein QM791_21565 [Ferruginibacter sp.]